jgi:hypothetical protein
MVHPFEREKETLWQKARHVLGRPPEFSVGCKDGTADDAGQSVLHGEGSATG